MNIKQVLSDVIEEWLEHCGAPGPALVRLATSKLDFGDYQVDGIMAAAKAAKTNPLDLAKEIAGRLVTTNELRGVLIAVDVSPAQMVTGPGFINIRLSDEFLAKQLCLNAPVVPVVEKVKTPQRVVVDYSCPNLAKEMHVGHLRSTIIGDAAARILKALGHEVIRQNHVGDWGTQFGMLLAQFDAVGGDVQALDDLEEFYRAASVRFREEPAFAAASRAKVVALQSGEAEARVKWRRFIDISLSHCQQLYERLGVGLTDADVMAESAYNNSLAETVALLEGKGLLTESDGARCVFLPEFTGKDGQPAPVIVQKSDGGYLYATTDLAAVRHRADALRADRVLYFTDSRQTLHFQQVFAVAEAAGFKPAAMSLEHMPFGAMLGKDGRPFKTRQGGVVKLNALLDEAEARALALVREKNPSLPAAEQAAAAQVLGVGAVKYADLAKNRASDYVFDWDQMLAFEGNTAPYLLYAYARIQSLFRRGGVDAAQLSGCALPPRDPHPAERRLAVALVRLQEVLEQAAADGRPHLLCAYLYELATKFTGFYEECPILTAAEADKEKRLNLAQQTARTLGAGLDLLGIGVVQRM